MGESPSQCDALRLLGRVYREQRTGVLSLGSEDQRLSVALLDGQIVGLCPSVGAPEQAEPPLAGPDDSARLKLERVLAEIGMPTTRPTPRTPPAVARQLSDLRDRLLAGLSQGGPGAVFEEVAELPDVVPTAGGTEPLILEAVRRIRDAESVRSALGDLDQRLVATASLTEERTLTLTEGYLLSRIDGLSTAQQVLQLVPLDPEETERSLLGLLLTGRVELHPVPAVATAQRADATPTDQAPFATPPSPNGEPPSMGRDEAPPSGAAMDPETLARRREILETFQSLPLKDHFEILGVEPGCSDADVKRAYMTLAKRFHPDVHHDARLDDLHDVLEAIFIRVGEAWEVLGDSRSRASYESRLGHLPVRRPERATPAPDTGRPLAPPARPTLSETDAEPFFPSEETLFQAQLFITQTHYWEAIQVLEAALPRLQPKRQLQRGRILLARAYAKNPKWLRRAEDTLQDVVRDDPSNAEAHYELGILYKASGLAARAHAMFRKTLEIRPDHREAAAELTLAEGQTSPGILKRFFGRSKGS